MITALAGGIITGLIVAFSIGPIFLTLLQLSINKGFKKAIYFILGTSFADITMISIIWFGLNKIRINTENPIISLIGAIVLILFGLSFIFNKKSSSIKETSSLQNNILGNSGLFFKAILLDIFNPLVWAFWAGVIGYNISHFNGNTNQLIYLTGVLLTTFSTDLLKSHYAQKLKPILSDKYLQYMNYGIGLLLIGLGVNLLFLAELKTLF